MIIILFGLFSLDVFAQDFSSLLLPPKSGSHIRLENSLLPSSKVINSKEKSKVSNTHVTMGHNFITENKLSYSLGANYQHIDFDQQGALRDYYQYQVSLGVRKNLSKNRFWFTNINYGTASDKPFKNNNDETISANFIQKTSDKWFFVLNYSNNRSFLNNIPIPGFFYLWHAKKERTTIVGFPFIFTQHHLGTWSYQYFGLLPWWHQVKVYYQKLYPWRLYAGYDQKVINFFRHDRDNREERVFFFEKKLGLGLEYAFRNTAKIDLFIGHAFEREIFEAKNFDANKSRKIRFSDSGFLETKLLYSF